MDSLQRIWFSRCPCFLSSSFEVWVVFGCSLLFHTVTNSRGSLLKLTVFVRRKYWNLMVGFETSVYLHVSKLSMGRTLHSRQTFLKQHQDLWKTPSTGLLLVSQMPGPVLHFSFSEYIFLINNFIEMLMNIYNNLIITVQSIQGIKQITLLLS